MCHGIGNDINHPTLFYFSYFCSLFPRNPLWRGVHSRGQLSHSMITGARAPSRVSPVRAIRAHTNHLGRYAESAISRAISNAPNDIESQLGPHRRPKTKTMLKKKTKKSTHLVAPENDAAYRVSCLVPSGFSRAALFLERLRFFFFFFSCLQSFSTLNPPEPPIPPFTGGRRTRPRLSRDDLSRVSRPSLFPLLGGGSGHQTPGTQNSETFRRAPRSIDRTRTTRMGPRALPPRPHASPTLLRFGSTRGPSHWGPPFYIFDISIFFIIFA